MPVDVLEKPATVEDAARGVSRIRSMVTDAVEDGMRSARQAIKHGRYAAEDVIEEAEHAIKRRPFQTMGWVFAAGVVVGGFLTWFGVRRRCL